MNTNPKETIVKQANLSILLAMFVATNLTAAETPFRFTGTVVDETLKPLAGSKVVVIGADRAATTDAGGKFEMSGAMTDTTIPCLEITATGHEQTTFRPETATVTGQTLVVWSFAEPKAGDRVDLARWAYVYRKGSPANPPETTWLEPDPARIFGLLLESPRSLRTLEVEFLAGAGQVPPVTDLTGVWYPIKAARFGLWPSWWQAPSAKDAVPMTAVPAQAGSRPNSIAFAFPAGKPCDKAAIRFSGNVADTARFTTHLYGDATWRKPLEIEIEWGFAGKMPEGGGQRADVKDQKMDGHIEAYQGYVTDLKPLADSSVKLTGQRHWRDNPDATGRRGIHARVWLTDNPTQGYTDQTPYANRTIVTVWTSVGGISFAPSDLDKGPILIPSAGIFVTKEGSGLTAAQFQKEVAASGKKTIRQRVREHTELNWSAAMAAVFPGKTLPPIPAPDEKHLPPGMTIDVPEKALNDQWRLGASHLQANTDKLPNGSYMVSIWANRPPKRGGPMVRTVLAMESFQVLRAYDLIGLPQFAEGGLNYWLQSEKKVNPPGNLTQRDNYSLHKEGHGSIQATAGFHYQMTRNDEWRKKVLPELQASYDLTQQWRKEWSGSLPANCWAAGLLPPMALSGDMGGHRMGYRFDAVFQGGLAAIAEMVALDDPQRGQAMRQEAQTYRQAIRRAVDRSVALTPVMQVQDGTYRRYMPYGPYTRGLWPTFLFIQVGRKSDWSMWHDNVANGLSVCWKGVYDPREPAVQDTFDVVEDIFLQHGGKSAEPWFDLSGYHSQCGHEPQGFVHFMAGDVPLAIRALYAQYASEIIPENGYRFREHPFTNCYGGNNDKTFEEAAFLERVRMMLVQEEGDNLWLSRFCLREWFEQGKKISVTNSPTFFGPVEYSIISDVDNGKINATIKMPARNPPQEVRLSLRHPKSAPIKSVTVNGKEWKDFNKDKETITLKDLTGTVAVTAQY